MPPLSLSSCRSSVVRRKASKRLEWPSQRQQLPQLSCSCSAAAIAMIIIFNNLLLNTAAALPTAAPLLRGCGRRFPIKINYKCLLIIMPINKPNNGASQLLIRLLRRHNYELSRSPQRPAGVASLRCCRCSYY